MSKAILAPISLRIRAFFIDIFIIAIPLLYTTTYLILGSKQKFMQDYKAIFLIWLLYGLITSIFYAKCAQTPGYRAYNLYLLDNKTKSKLSFIRCFIRYFLFILINSTFILAFIPFFRKDRKNLYDIFTNSIVAKKLD